MPPEKPLSHVTRLQITSALQAVRVASQNDPQVRASLKPVIEELEAILAGQQKAG